MKKSVSWLVVGGVVVVVAIALVCYLLTEGDKTSFRKDKDLPRHTSAPSSEKLAGMREVVKTYMEGKGKTRGVRSKRLLARLDRSMFDNLSEADRKLCEAVQDALDAEDAARTIELASQLLVSENPEARSHAVDALGWFGPEALPELTMLMGDADEDVAQNAINAWESGVSEIDDAAARLKVSGMAMKAIFSKDALQSIAAQFSTAATELIDAEEDAQTAFDKRVEVVQSVVDLIDSPNSTLSEVGRDLYEDITGHEWISLSEAERYLNDPDNYEPPMDAATDAVVEVPDATEHAPAEAAAEKSMDDESKEDGESTAAEAAAEKSMDDESKEDGEGSAAEEGKATDSEDANLSHDADLGQDSNSNQ